MDKNLFKKHSTKVVYSAKNKLNNIIKLGKDKNEKCNNANVVYQIKCKDCNASYVGQTSRRLNGKRLFSEALFIHTQKNYLNKQYEM